MIRRIARLSFTLGVLAVTWLSLAPQEALPPIGMWDKANHVLAYAALSLSGGIGFVERRSALMVSLGLVVLGCGLEAGQVAVPGREPSIGDAVADIVGVGLGMATAWIGNRLVGASEGSTP